MKKILIVEDDMISRKFLTRLLKQYGECDLVVDGLEAIDAYLLAIKENKPYDLICLDVMIPKLDGIKVLKTIRDLEHENSIPQFQSTKIVMTTALDDSEIFNNAFELGCDAYTSKPIDIIALKEVLGKIGIIGIT